MLSTFVKQTGTRKYKCLLTEHEFRTELEAEQHQSAIIRRLQSQGLLQGDFNFGHLDRAYRKNRAA